MPSYLDRVAGLDPVDGKGIIGIAVASASLAYPWGFVAIVIGLPYRFCDNGKFLGVLGEVGIWKLTEKTSFELGPVRRGLGVPLRTSARATAQLISQCSI